MTKKDRLIAEYLAEKGLEFSLELNGRNREYFDYLADHYFAIAAAISLCWTGHAQYEDKFIEYASSFIDGTVAKDSSMAKKYARRFGEEKLDMALRGFRSFFRRIRNKMPDFKACSIQDINKLQVRSLSLLDSYRQSGEVVGIGPWLFLGPFKIILEDQDRLWENEGIGAIIMPTGYEVNKGILKLKAEGYKIMNDFDVNWLEQNNSILDNFATCHMVHSHIIKIAEFGKSSALHINSALYKYGRDEI